LKACPRRLLSFSLPKFLPSRARFSSRVCRSRKRSREIRPYPSGGEWQRDPGPASGPAWLPLIETSETAELRAIEFPPDYSYGRLTKGELPLHSGSLKMKRYGEHRFPGKLFVVEGIDGSGKSTQLNLLHQWLLSEGYGVVFSEWNSSPLVRDVTKRGKKKRMLVPSTFSLIHATDFADRVEHNIIPLLKAGAVVLCDRYIYTAFARDVVRGMDPQWVRELYAFAVKPTVAFYFRIPLEVATKRLHSGRNGFKFYEAGMDLDLSEDPDESFRLFQGRIVEEYEKMITEFDLTLVDATLPIETQQQHVRQIVKARLAQAKRLRIAP
jgi:dTMP kinase